MRRTQVQDPARAGGDPVLLPPLVWRARFIYLFREAQVVCDISGMRPARCGVLAFARACPATSPPIPCARACARRAANALRAARSEARAARIWSAHPDRGRSTAQRAVIAALSTALPRRPKRARAMLIPVYDAELARRRLRFADPKQGGARGAAAASCGLGLKLRMPREGAAPLSPLV